MRCEAYREMGGAQNSQAPRRESTERWRLPLFWVRPFVQECLSVGLYRRIVRPGIRKSWAPLNEGLRIYPWSRFLFFIGEAFRVTYREDSCSQRPGTLRTKSDVPSLDFTLGP